MASELDFTEPSGVSRGSGVRTEHHTRSVGERVRCLDTGEVGEIFAYDLCGDYLVDVGSDSLRQLDDGELGSVL